MGSKTGPISTKVFSNPPSVLLVGGSANLFARCNAVSASLGVACFQATMGSVTNDAATYQPLVLAVVEELFMFDPTEFEALARDVRGCVLLVQESMGDDDLKRLMLRALAKGSERRG